MKIKSRTIALLLLSSCLPALADDAALVSEIPQGAINGWNTTFVLSHTPIASMKLEVFRNGLELLADTDYQVTDSSITLSSQQIPTVGDEIKVSYSTDDQLSPAPPSDPPVLVPSTTTEILSIADRQALATELRHISAIRPPKWPRVIDRESGSREVSEGVSRRDSDGSRGMPLSLRMLAQSVGNSQDGERAARGLKVRQRFSAEGAEGLGDLPTSTVFDGGDRAANDLLQISDTRSISSSRPSAAINLLQRRLRAVGPQETEIREDLDGGDGVLVSKHKKSSWRRW